MIAIKEEEKRGKKQSVSGARVCACKHKKRQQQQQQHQQQSQGFRNKIFTDVCIRMDARGNPTAVPPMPRNQHTYTRFVCSSSFLKHNLIPFRVLFYFLRFPSFYFCFGLSAFFHPLRSGQIPSRETEMISYRSVAKGRARETERNKKRRRKKNPTQKPWNERAGSHRPTIVVDVGVVVVVVAAGRP